MPTREQSSIEPPRNAFISGLRSISPFIVGLVPFAIVTGVTAITAGLSPVQAVVMSALVFAGAAQLTAIDLIGKTGPLAVVLVTPIIVNLRLLMYSASIAPHLRKLSIPWKLVCAFGLTDPTYAVSLAEYRNGQKMIPTRGWFFLGTAVGLWGTWQVGTAIGAVAGHQWPNALPLGFAVPLGFLALLVPTLEDESSVVAAALGGGSAVLLSGLPFQLGLIVAAIVGVFSAVGLNIYQGAFPRRKDVEPVVDAERTDGQEESK
jgi:4-azaleucine resistance transporter AzlC